MGKLNFQELMSGEPKTFTFGGQTRKVDNVLSTTAKEIKSGKLKGSEFIDNQLQKDIMMLGDNNVPIKKIEWHLFDGADASMIEKLELLKSTFGAEKFDYIIY
jgi:predicted PolB exonuclease-like 3'-5' exonuclease